MARNIDQTSRLRFLATVGLCGIGMVLIAVGVGLAVFGVEPEWWACIAIGVGGMATFAGLRAPTWIAGSIWRSYRSRSRR